MNKMRISFSNITSLAFNEIFVFGSNLVGHHYSGISGIAREKFGVVWGQGVGLQGQCYPYDAR